MRMPLGRRAGRLLCHARHGTPFGGKEVHAADRVGLQPLASTTRVGSPRLSEAGARRPRAVHRQDPARLVEQGAGVWRLPAWQPPRPAGSSANLPSSGMQTSSHTSQLASAASASCRDEVGRWRDLHQQQDVVLEAVIDDAADVDQRRRRPEDRVGLGAGREVPGDLRRQARDRRDSSSRYASAA